MFEQLTWKHIFLGQRRYTENAYCRQEQKNTGGQLKQTKPNKGKGDGQNAAIVSKCSF